MPITLALAAVPALGATPPRNVLVLYADNRLLPGIAILDEAFESALRAKLGVQVDSFNEFLDLDRLPQANYREGLVRFLREKYAGTRIDAVVAVRGPALEFVLRHRDELFAGVPVVHAAIAAPELAGRALPADVIGVPIVFDPARTIELALRLHRGTERIVVITGTSEFDRSWEARLRVAFREFEQRVVIDFWAGLPYADILARLRKLAAGTVVFVPVFMQDGTGQRFVPRHVAVEMVQASPAPMYGAYSVALGSGFVGGYVAPLEDVGRHAADLVVRLLQGEAPQSTAVPAAVENVYLLDARQLRRFGVRESDLPPESILKYREPTIWEAYRWHILGVLVLLLAQAALIAALLVQRRVRRRAEAELRESEQRMSLVAAATRLGMWVQDIPRGTFWASPQHRGLLGLSESEPYDTESFLRAVHQDDRDAVRNALQRTLAGGGEFEARFRVPLADGSVRWVASRGRVELDERGRPVRLRGATADVTAREEAELEAQRHRNELAHLSRIAMLGQLSGSLAHELNQPLTAILSNAQAALRFLKVEPADLVEVREILSDIVAADQRAGDVIRRLRALFERGEALREPLDLNELLREVLQLLHGDLVSRNVAVSTDLDPTLPEISGDRVQLQQLLLNLAVNACEAMADTPPLERRLTVRSARTGNDEAVLSVSDRGKGIAADQLERIFEPFVSGKDVGIGLGLAISRSIVAAHGGRIWAERNPDGGATLSFTLPVEGAARPPAASVASDAEALDAPAAASL